MGGLALQLWRSLRLRLAERRNWLQLAARAPTSAFIDWGCRIFGSGASKRVFLEDGVVIRAATLDLAGGSSGVVRLGEGTVIHSTARIVCPSGSVVFGRQCTLNPNAVVYGHGGVAIGDYVRIASNVVIVATSHRYARVDVPIALQGEQSLGIHIEADVWIGANAVILDGVRLGRGAIVAAGAVVTGDVAPFTIVGGVPSRLLRQRDPNAAEAPLAVL